MVSNTTSPTAFSDLDPQERAAMAARRTGNGDVSADATATQKNQSGYSTSYSNYLFGSAGQNDKPLWSDSTKGRLAIRLVSRGIVGAAAFAWGQRVAREQMIGYEPHRWDKSKPLHYVAKAFDSTLGKVISGGARMLAPTGQGDLWAFDATRFRTNAYFHRNKVGLNPGRSYGAEIVGITFDFFCASIGDALVRNIFQELDPNNKKSWLVDAKGEPATRGRIVWGELGKAILRKGWRIFSYNGLEDFAVAPIYAYQMKWQRQLLSSKFKGFGLSADNGSFGASIFFNKDGTLAEPRTQEVAGAIDLHCRFVGYNWYTLMYREAYNGVANAFGKWKSEGFKLSVPKLDDPLKAIGETMGQGIRYVMKSFVKANLYMQPAVLPFWLIRVPQTKWRAPGIMVDADVDKNALLTTEMRPHIARSVAAETGESARSIYARMIRPTPHANRPVVNGVRQASYEFCYSAPSSMYRLEKGVHLRGLRNHDHGMFAGGIKLEGPITELKSVYGPESYGTSWFSRLLNPIGKACFTVGTYATRASDYLPDGIKDALAGKKYDAKAPFGPVPDPELKQKRLNGQREEFVRTFTDASLAYTPYMFAKAELGLMVDERPADGSLGKMDKAIYRLIDSTFTLNGKGVISAIKDIKYHYTHHDTPRKGREGDENPEKETVIVPPMPEAPRTQVKTSTVQQTPVVHTPVVESSNTREPRQPHQPRQRGNNHDRADQAQGRHADDRQWAENVTGRKLTGGFQQSGNTLH